MIADWLKAANPFRAPTSHDEALRSARCGSIALIVTTLGSLPATLWIALNMDRFTAGLMEMVQASPGVPPEQAELTMAWTRTFLQMMALPILVMTVVFFVVYLILAVVQWRKPNIVIPIIFLTLAAYGLVSSLFTALTNPAAMQAAWAIYPPVITGLGWLVQLISAILLVASLRGALSLKRFG